MLGYILMKKKPLNLTFHPGIIELADRLMAVRHYASLSTLIEDLIREKYEQANGLIAFEKDPTSSLNKKTLAAAKRLAEERDKKRGKRGVGDPAQSSQNESRG